MPKTRWPIRSASVCRIFPGARLSARHRANALTKPYTRSAALSRTAPPSELACSWLNVATRGLSNRSGNRTLCGIVSGVTQGPPSWLNVCIHYVCTTRRPFVSLPKTTPSRIIRANNEARLLTLPPVSPLTPLSVTLSTCLFCVGFRFLDETVKAVLVGFLSMRFFVEAKNSSNKTTGFHGRNMSPDSARGLHEDTSQSWPWTDMEVYRRTTSSGQAEAGC